MFSRRCEANNFGTGDNHALKNYRYNEPQIFNPFPRPTLIKQKLRKHDQGKRIQKGARRTYLPKLLADREGERGVNTTLQQHPQSSGGIAGRPPVSSHESSPLTPSPSPTVQPHTSLDKDKKTRFLPPELSRSRSTSVTQISEARRRGTLTPLEWYLQLDRGPQRLLPCDLEPTRLLEYCDQLYCNDVARRKAGNDDTGSDSGLHTIKQKRIDRGSYEALCHLPMQSSFYRMERHFIQEGKGLMNKVYNRFWDSSRPQPLGTKQDLVANAYYSGAGGRVHPFFASIIRDKNEAQANYRHGEGVVTFPASLN